MDYFGLSAEITIPNGITKINKYAFYDVDSLTKIVIPNSVTSIGDDAFSYSNSLTNVTIGSDVTSIGDYAFYNCNSLTSIAFNGTVDEWNNITKGFDWKFGVSATKVVCTDGEVALS